MDLQDSWLSTIMAYEHLSLIRAGCCGPDGGCLHHRESNACPDGYTRYRSHSAGCRGCRAAHGNTHPDPGHWRHRRGPGGGHARRHPHADTCANRYSDADTTSNGYPDATALSNGYPYPDTRSNPYPDADADACANGHPDTNARSNPYPDADACANGHPDTNARSNRYPDSDA